MFDLSNLAHHVSHLDEPGVRIAPRADHMQAPGTRGQSFQDLLDRQQPVMDCVVDLVDNDHIVPAGLHFFQGCLPGLPGGSSVPLRRLPAVGSQEATPHRADLEVFSQQAGGLHLPGPDGGLDELDHQHPAAMAHCTQRCAEGGGGLALTLSGEDHQQAARRLSHRFTVARPRRPLQSAAGGPPRPSPACSPLPVEPLLQ